MSNEPPSSVHTIAFYNVENLFDTENDIYTNDDDFLPSSAKKWTEKRYRNKLQKLGAVISTIGDTVENEPPSIIGLAEIENKQVLLDLITLSTLNELPYDFVHFDSSDERGIDVALLYDSRVFEVRHAEPIPIYMEDQNSNRDYTRDILYVKGFLESQTIHIFVNHWPSRREGSEATKYKRLAACEQLLDKITSLQSQDPKDAIIVMGDFNDNPIDPSLATLENVGALFNPFRRLWSPYDRGSLNHNFQWYLFDQILFSHHILNASNSHLEFIKADIFDKHFITRYKGRFKGHPFRTYAGKKYLGGYSDHFPVFVKFGIKG